MNTSAPCPPCDEPLRFARPAVAGLVSVVIPAHRAERYIGTTLDSVGLQSYADWEVIVVEDGSTGPTEAIVAGFASRCPTRRVVYTRHAVAAGPAAARNTAFRLAQGEFVALLDADDRWQPDHLRSAVDSLRAGGADVAFSTAIMVRDGSDAPIGIWGPTPVEMATFPQSLFSRSFITPSATVMRRRVIESVGPWNERLRVCEDFEYWLRTAAAGKSFCHVGGAHCLYRKHHRGAATANISFVVTQLAMTGERLLTLNVPGTQPGRSRRRVAAVFMQAARLNATQKPSQDSSADRRQAARLAYRGWRLEPRRLKRLVQSGWYAIRFGVKRERKQARGMHVAAVAPEAIQTESRRAA